MKEKKEGKKEKKRYDCKEKKNLDKEKKGKRIMKINNNKKI